MSRILFVQRKHLTLIVAAMVITALLVWMFQPSSDMQVSGAKEGDSEIRTIHMVTGEYSTSHKGKKIESYRWDPGTIVVREGESIELKIFGVNGESHPFIIEGTNIKGEVKKGKETVVKFKANKKGTYRIICSTHHDHEKDGPMIGYIEVI